VTSDTGALIAEATAASARAEAALLSAQDQIDELMGSLRFMLGRPTRARFREFGDSSSNLDQMYNATHDPFEFDEMYPGRLKLADAVTETHPETDVAYAWVKTSVGVQLTDTDRFIRRGEVVLAPLQPAADGHMCGVLRWATRAEVDEAVERLEAVENKDAARRAAVAVKG
jgi:hypothetical protein